MRRAAYIPIDHIKRDSVLRAELSSGQLKYFGTDTTGREFYTQSGHFPEIHAQQYDNDIEVTATDDENDDDDSGCEFYELNASGERVTLEGMEHVGRVRGIPKPLGLSAEESEADVEAVAERHLQSYYTLLERRVSGEDINPEFGRAILRLAGKSEEEFDAEVAEIQRIDMELGNNE